MTNTTNTMDIEVKKLENSEIEITGEISTEKFESYREKAVKKLAETVNIDGFRKGNIPEAVLIKEVGEMVVLEEMAQSAIAAEYPNMILEQKIEAIGQPQISITKIAAKSPLGFKIKTAIMPKLELPNYKEISEKEMKEREEVSVEDKEVEDTIQMIRKQRAAADKKATEGEEGAEGEGGDQKIGEELTEDELPEFNDEFVKTLGDFKDIEDFKVKLKENLKVEKESKARQKKRMAIIEKIIDGTKVDLPEIVVESELDRMMHQFQGDIARMGLKFEEYIKHIKKTEEDLKKEWRTDAEKRAKTQLVLNKIAVEEKIVPEKEKIDHEVKHLMEHYKDADENAARSYVETILTNELVFQFLEGGKGEKTDK
ncbi:trigger factor [Patescibacteria group bacterium]